MLQSLHENIKGWVAGIIIGIISLSFVMWGIQSYVSSSSGDAAPVAKVNGDKITLKELKQASKNLQRQVASSGVALTEQVNAQINSMALDRLILNKLMLDAADNMGLYVGANEASQYVASMPQFQVNGQFSQQRLQQYLYSTSTALPAFEAQVKERLLLQQSMSGFQSTAFVLPSEATQLSALINQKRAIAYVIVPAQRFSSEVSVNQKEIKRYYNQHQNNFKTLEKVSINYIQLSPEEISKTIHVSAAEVKQYYQDNISNYTVPKQWKLERIFVQVKDESNPQDKAEAQKSINAIEASLGTDKKFASVLKEQQGFTQTLAANVAPPPILSALDALKAGQVSKPFYAQKGYNIVRLLSVTQGRTKAFVEVREQIKKMLITEKLQSEMAAMNDKLSDLVYTNPDSLKPAAKELNVKVQKTSFFTRDGAKDGVASDKNVVSAAFSSDVLQQSLNSPPLTLKDGSVVVLRMQKHQPSTVLPIKQVSAGIKKKLETQMGQAKAALLAGKIVGLSANSAGVSQALSKHDLRWKQVESLSRTDKALPAELVSSAFSLLSQGAMVTAVLSSGDTAVVKLKIIKPSNQQSNLVSITRSYLAQLGQIEYQFYILGLKHRADIKLLPANKKT
jgi:peptidyl-prolyl cis-trans isomerase D